MGSSARAEKISSSFKDRAMRALVHYFLDKCGSCPYRFICVGKMLGSRDPYRTIYDHMKHCDLRDGNKGTIGKAIAQFAETCLKCEKKSVCVEYVSVLVQRPYEEVSQITERCMKCPQLPNCAEAVLKDLGLDERTILMNAIKRFTWCKAKKMHPMMR